MSVSPERRPSFHQTTAAQDWIDHSRAEVEDDVDDEDVEREEEEEDEEDEDEDEEEEARAAASALKLLCLSPGLSVVTVVTVIFTLKCPLASMKLCVVIVRRSQY